MSQTALLYDIGMTHFSKSLSVTDLTQLQLMLNWKINQLKTLLDWQIFYIMVVCELWQNMKKN